MRKSLTRKERLRKQADIKAMYGSTARVAAHGVKLLFRPNGHGTNRMAVVVSRGCGGAVKRNREKRITREAYRDLKPGLKGNMDLLLIVGNFGQSFQERRSTLVGLFRRAKLSGDVD